MEFLRGFQIHLSRTRHRTTILLMDILQMLYDSEINFEVSCFWDARIDWKLGDPTNGYEAEGNADTVALAIEALKEAALKLFPESQFALQVRATP